MITIYQIKDNGFIGESKTIDPREGVSSNWTYTPPPDNGVYKWEHGQWVAGVEPDLSIPSANTEVIIADIIEKTQERLDDFAKTRKYDSILSACTYATSIIPKFAAEGQYCVELRDNTWSTLYSIMEEVEAGSRAAPIGFSEVSSELPGLEWPI